MPNYCQSILKRVILCLFGNTIDLNTRKMGLYEYDLQPVAANDIGNEPDQINRTSYNPHSANK